MAWINYLATLVVFLFIDVILALGLNIQFGYTGILNFAYITFFAIGGYTAAVTTLGPAGRDIPGIHYILGLSAPFLIALAFAAIAAGLGGVVIGWIALRRLRSDYLAITVFCASLVVYDFVNNFGPLFNGTDGIAGVPAPFNGVLQLDLNTYTFFYIGLTGVIMAILFVVAQRLHRSPLGRTMRAIREDVDVAAAFGKDTGRIRMIAMVIGCVYAGIGGALIVGFVGGLNPSGWRSAETFIVFAAVLVGGRGNNWGVALGALLVPVIFIEASTQLLPVDPANPELGAALQGLAVGVLVIATIWFRPDGILPERRWRLRQKHGLAGRENGPSVIG
jgi:branched-chain amino acid transport system permease protein